jgi:PAS domain S-box-containing protein
MTQKEIAQSSKSGQLKRQFLVYFSGIGIISLLGFGIFSITLGNTLYGSFEITAAILGLLNVLFFLKYKDEDITSMVLLCILSVVLLVLLITGGIGNTGLLWMPTFPALAFFLLDKKKSVYANISFLIAIVVLIGLGGLGVFQLAFSFVELRQFFISYLVLTVIIFFYEMSSENTWEKLVSRTKELAVINKKIDEQAAQREKRKKEAEESVVELENTKKAMLNIMEDLQEQQQRLLNSKAKDEAMLVSIGDGLIATDEVGQILFTNPSFERMLGWKQQEVVGKKLIEVAPLVTDEGEPIPPQERIVSQTLQTGELTRYTDKKVSYLTKSGEKLPVSITVSPIIVNGAVTGAIEVFRDITKETEIDKAKTEFVSLASHQLKTPLSAINWYSELLLSQESGTLNQQQQDYLAEITSGSKRMVDLVNALLNVSRLELGTFSIEPAMVEILPIVRSVLDELKSEIDAKDLTLHEKHDTLPAISADPNLTRIVVQNILTNAVKYTPQGGSVTVRLLKAQKGSTVATKTIEADSILYSVTDTGYGIPKKQQSKIFTKLFRADNVQEKDTDGTGLGLYIIKSILDSFGGAIWFESAENKGTTFYITIPLTGMVAKEGSRTLELRNAGN